MSDPDRRFLPRNRYSLLVGLVFAVVAAIALFNAVTGREADMLGLSSDEVGQPLAPFAVPDVRSELEGDANIDAEAACEVDLAGAIRLCDFADRPLVISFWFTRGGDCTGQQDVVSALYERYSDQVGFLSINVRDDRGHVADLANAREWKMPVGHDRDGALSNLYRVGVCPTFIFADPGLRLREAVIGELDADEMEARVRRLLAAGPTDP